MAKDPNKDKVKRAAANKRQHQKDIKAARNKAQKAAIGRWFDKKPKDLGGGITQDDLDAL